MLYLYTQIKYKIMCLADFNSGKTQLVSFDWSNNTDAIDVKMDGSNLVEKLSVWWCSVKKGVLRNSAKFTQKICPEVSF